MNENIENIVKIDTSSFQDMCKRIIELEEENKQLKANNRIIGDELTYFKEYAADLENEVNRKERMVRGLKLNNSRLSIERNNLQTTIDDMKNTHKYLTAEDAGRKFAWDLLGGA